MFTATHPARDKVFLEVNATSPINPDSSTWTRPDSLNAFTCGQHTYLSTVDYWHASEHDSLTSTQAHYEYLAAWSDLTQSIDVTALVLPPSSCSTDSFAMNCPSVTDAPRNQPAVGGPIQLSLSGPSRARGPAANREPRANADARGCLRHSRAAGQDASGWRSPSGSKLCNVGWPENGWYRDAQRDLHCETDVRARTTGRARVPDQVAHAGLHNALTLVEAAP